MPRPSTVKKIASLTYGNIEVTAMTQLGAYYLSYTGLPRLMGPIGAAAFNSGATLLNKFMGNIISKNLQDLKEKTILQALDCMKEELTDDLALDEKLTKSLEIMRSYDLEPADFCEPRYKNKLADTLLVDNIKDLDLLVRPNTATDFIIKHYIPYILGGVVGFGVGTAFSQVPIVEVMPASFIQSAATLLISDIISGVTSYAIERIYYTGLPIKKEQQPPIIFYNDNLSEDFDVNLGL